MVMNLVDWIQTVWIRPDVWILPDPEKNTGYPAASGSRSGAPLVFSSKWFFQRRIRFWSKIYDSWKVTLLPFLLENSKTKTGQD